MAGYKNGYLMELQRGREKERVVDTVREKTESERERGKDQVAVRRVHGHGGGLRSHISTGYGQDNLNKTGH